MRTDVEQPPKEDPPQSYHHLTTQPRLVSTIDRTELQMDLSLSFFKKKKRHNKEGLITFLFFLSCLFSPLPPLSPSLHTKLTGWKKEREGERKRNGKGG